MKTVRNAKGREIEEILREEKGIHYVEDHGYLIYWILDEMRKKNIAEKMIESESKGKILEDTSFNFAEINIEEVKKLVEYGIKISKDYGIVYPEMCMEIKEKRLREAIHNQIFDIKINDEIPAIYEAHPYC